MSWVRFSLAVAGTSIALVVVLVAAGGLFVGNALARTGADLAQQQAFDSGKLPPELANLKDIPPAERFAHFRGVQAELTDRDGKPIDIAVVPGKASAVSATSITLSGNDGASHTFAITDDTYTRGKTVAPGDNVVVISMGNTPNARAVFAVDTNGWHHFSH